MFELRASGRPDASVELALLKRFDERHHMVWHNVTVRAQRVSKPSLYAECSVSVLVRSRSPVRAGDEQRQLDAAFLPRSFSVIFNTYAPSTRSKSSFLSSSSSSSWFEARVPLDMSRVDPASNVSFRLVEPKHSARYVRLDPFSGRLSLLPHLAAAAGQRHLNVSFDIVVAILSAHSNSSFSVLTRCHLGVLTLSDALIAQSVTLRLSSSSSSSSFLEHSYERLVHTLGAALLRGSLLHARLHVFAIDTTATSDDNSSVQVTFGVSLDLQNDVFAAGSLVRHLMRARLPLLEVVDDVEEAEACGHEPCLNYQQVLYLHYVCLHVIILLKQKQNINEITLKWAYKYAVS